jgi:hypothetical protein
LYLGVIHASPMAAREQEGKAWLRIMRTHNS